jgi:hypothetical protein
MLAVPAWLLFSSKLVDRDDTESVGGNRALCDRVGVPLTSVIEPRR